MNALESHLERRSPVSHGDRPEDDFFQILDILVLDSLVLDNKTTERLYPRLGVNKGCENSVSLKRVVLVPRK